MSKKNPKDVKKRIKISRCNFIVIKRKQKLMQKMEIDLNVKMQIKVPFPEVTLKWKRNNCK